MLKKILFTLFAMLVTYSSATVIYHIFEPHYESSDAVSHIYYDSLDEYFRSQPSGSTHYLYFYSVYSRDCRYVLNTVLATVDSEIDPDVFKIIDIVDVSDLDHDDSLYQLQEKWKVSSVPSFATVQLNETPRIVSTLESDGDTLLSAGTIEKWLVDCGLNLGAGFNAQQVEVPVP